METAFYNAYNDHVPKLGDGAVALFILADADMMGNPTQVVRPNANPSYPDNWQGVRIDGRNLTQPVTLTLANNVDVFIVEPGIYQQYQIDAFRPQTFAVTKSIPASPAGSLTLVFWNSPVLPEDLSIDGQNLASNVQKITADIVGVVSPSVIFGNIQILGSNGANQSGELFPLEPSGNGYCSNMFLQISTAANTPWSLTINSRTDSGGDTNWKMNFLGSTGQVVVYRDAWKSLGASTWAVADLPADAVGHLLYS